MEHNQDKLIMKITNAYAETYRLSESEVMRLGSIHSPAEPSPNLAPQAARKDHQIRPPQA